jgi:alkaline phosphatase D
MALSRRRFVWIVARGAAAAPLVACAASNGGTGSGAEPGPDDDAGRGPGPDGGYVEPQPDAGEQDAGLPPVSEQPAFDFVHGVASGDPLGDRVILWTRVSPMEVIEGEGELIVDFVVATDPTMNDVVGHGRATTSAARDFTVKVDVSDLEPGTTYYYEFFDPSRPAEVRSPLGRTRTLPVGSVERARFAVASCSCYALGYFHAYAEIAARSDLDAVLHLGDYIYEYGPEIYADDTVMRPHAPDHEILNLDDYRTRFAQYRTDPDLQEAHRQHPFITIWDDHETANDAFRDGAENHSEATEGSYEARRTAALTAYHEWMPIRDLDAEDLTLIYRRFSFGDLCDLIMLETRTKRDRQDGGARENPARTLLGPAQTEWLEGELSDSYARGTTWRLLGQQVMFGQLPGAVNSDQWDGYVASRNRILDQLIDEGIDNVVVLTGDIHTAWAMDIAKDPATYDPLTGAGAQCVEFVCTSVTSPAIESAISVGGIGSLLLKQLCPYMKHIDLDNRGYMVLDVDHQRVQGEFYVTDDVKSMTGNLHTLSAAYAVQSGAAHLEPSDAAADPIAGRPPLA